MTYDLSRQSLFQDVSDRIGCSLITVRHLRIEAALDLVQSKGFRTVDIAMVPRFCDHVDPLSLTEEDLDRLAEALASRGLRTSSLNVHPGDLLGGDFETPTRYVKSCLRIAKRLNAANITIPSGPTVSEERWMDAAKLLAGRVRQLLVLAGDAGVRLSLEVPHVRSLAENISQARRLFELIQDSRIGCTFDTSHVQRTEECTLAEGYRRVGAEVVHVHLRDALGGKITVTPGKGDCDYLPFFRAIVEDGYKGDFNFELECEDAKPGAEEHELDFARDYIRIILEGAPVPFSYSIFKKKWYRVLQRTKWNILHPAEWIRTQPRLHSLLKPPVKLLRRVWRELLPHRQVVYVSGWQKRWQFGRSASRISFRPDRAVASESAGGAAKRIGILGCGYTGRFMHGPGFGRIPGMRVVCVCDVDRAKADLASREMGCPAYYDLAEMVRQVRPELVINCTREWQHHETSLLLFENGIDVFCEKIMAEDYRKGEEMVLAAREKGRVLGVNFNWRFLPGIVKIREVRDSGAIGKLRMLRFLCHSWVHHHVLDLARHLGGEIRSVASLIREEPESRSFQQWNRYVGEMLYMPSIYCMATMETANGIGVSLASTDLLDPGGLLFQMDAVFQEGTISLSGILDNNALGTLTASSSKRLDLRCDHADRSGKFSLSFQRSIEAFAEAYLAGKRCPATGEDALAVMDIERALMRSAESGAMVVLQR